MKSGTLALFYYLSQHPEILPSVIKEVHFFDNHFDRGERWYRAHFPLKKKVRKDCITGEASPLYIFNPLAAERINKLVPGAKLIAILRNPTERAISHYFMECNEQREHLPPMEALQQEKDRLNKVPPNDFGNSIYIHCSYKTRGIYIDQLERYWRHFSSEQLLVLNSEALFTERVDTIRKVFRFLDVDADFQPNDSGLRNVGRKDVKVESEVYEYLNDYFSRTTRPYTSDSDTALLGRILGIIAYRDGVTRPRFRVEVLRNGEKSPGVVGPVFAAI